MGKSGKRLRVCLAASAGGHLSQLLSLEPVWKDYEVVCVSTGQIVRDKLETMGKTYIVGECNREHPFKTIGVMWRCLRIILREKPDVVISTGAAVGCVLCFLGKLLGAKIVWVDSITNVERLSLSGRMVRYIADLFLVQWPDLAEQYKGVEYVGAAI